MGLGLIVCGGGSVVVFVWEWWWPMVVRLVDLVARILRDGVEFFFCKIRRPFCFVKHEFIGEKPGPKMEEK